ncbi:MAG: glycosyltransferase [Flavobacteriaceae bacterium]|nr:glycosyltransferase [Flavobacteriaceae bacterium]
MKVLQLIDSLDAGGAERIAVTLANVLSKEVEASHLCVTRAEGVLKRQLSSKVHFEFIRKKSTLDLRAVIKLRSYLKLYKIDVIHAHTTSYFFGTLVKIVYPKVKLIWHTHLGKRVDTLRRQNMMLYFCSLFFTSIIAVNQELKSWCLRKLLVSDVFYVPNFVVFPEPNEEVQNSRELSIVCLANLKTPKNHLNLIYAFQKIHNDFPNWKLLLAGKDFEDNYSKKLNEVIEDAGLENKVVFLGQQEEVDLLLSRCSIGVLASDSEGLPMVLLEYGMAELVVIATKVGHCEDVLAGFGLTVAPKDSNALSKGLATYMEDEGKRKTDSKLFRNHIRGNYSVEAVLPQLMNIYNKISY